MAETTVENRICISCGVEARPGALFCYNCGGAVSQETENGGEESTSDVWFQEDIIEKSEDDNSEPEKSEEKVENETQEDSVEEEIVSEKVEEETDKADEKDEKTQEKEKEKDSKEEIEKSEVEEKTDSEKETVNIKRKTQLKSASALRKRPKSLGSKKIEVVWEERDSSPNLLFISVAFILILIAFGVFLLAMYLK